MSNEEIISKVIRLYYDGGDWKEYLKEQVRKSEKFRELLKNVIGEDVK